MQFEIIGLSPLGVESLRVLVWLHILAVLPKFLMNQDLSGNQIICFQQNNE